jgi:nickel-dependent lactate racemase
LAEVGRGAFEMPRKEGRLPLVVIVIADHTRPVPDRLLVPWIVQELGVPDECVTILVGTGTHRGSTAEELRKMLGGAVDRFRIVNHDCEAARDMMFVGTSSCGGPCWMNRLWLNADLRVATGFIEPHFYAGFSGGSKAVIPGIAGLETVGHFHRAALIAQPNTSWARVVDNPLQRLTREMTAFCPPHFIVNVTLNRDREITGLYAGHVAMAHDAGCEAAIEEATIPCNKGLPEEGAFAGILADPRPDHELHRAIQCTETTRQDQWQVQTLLQCLEKARVILFSELSEKDRALTRTEHTSDPAETLRQLAAAAGKPLPVAILPLGPLTVATVCENIPPLREARGGENPSV